MAGRKPDDRESRSQRKRDPYLDRRSGEDRRKTYSVDYFLQNNPDRRSGLERRSAKERRKDCIRVDEWSSVCPDKDEIAEDKPYIIDLRKR